MFFNQSPNPRFPTISNGTQWIPKGFAIGRFQKSQVSPSCRRIQENHDHLLVIPDEDLVAGVEATYQTDGTSPHVHEVTITELLFEALSRAEAITAELMETEGHVHPVEVRCAPPN